MEIPGVEEVLHSVRHGGGVDEGDRVERALAEIRLRRMTLERVRGERIRAQWLRRLRRWLTVGRWR